MNISQRRDMILPDMGKVRPSKDKKDATTMSSKEMEKTRKVVKGHLHLNV